MRSSLATPPQSQSASGTLGLSSGTILGKGEVVHPLSLPFWVAPQLSLLTSSTFVNLSSPPATAELHSPAAEVKEGMVRAEGWAGMLSGPYLVWIPSCSSCLGANGTTTVLCSRLQREEGREET